MSANARVTLNPAELMATASASAAQAAPSPVLADAAKYGWEVVSDSNGRQLAVKKLDALEEFDLCEVAADKSGNSRSVMMMSLYAMVRAIDGEPLAFPRKMAHMRRHIER